MTMQVPRAVLIRAEAEGQGAALRINKTVGVSGRGTPEMTISWAWLRPGAVKSTSSGDLKPFIGRIALEDLVGQGSTA